MLQLKADRPHLRESSLGKLFLWRPYQPLAASVEQCSSLPMYEFLVLGYVYLQAYFYPKAYVTKSLSMRLTNPEK